MKRERLLSVNQTKAYVSETSSAAAVPREVQQHWSGCLTRRGEGQRALESYWNGLGPRAGRPRTQARTAPRGDCAAASSSVSAASGASRQRPTSCCRPPGRTRRGEGLPAHEDRNQHRHLGPRQGSTCCPTAFLYIWLSMPGACSAITATHDGPPQVKWNSTAKANFKVRHGTDRPFICGWRTWKEHRGARHGVRRDQLRRVRDHGGNFFAAAASGARRRPRLPAPVTLKPGDRLVLPRLK